MMRWLLLLLAFLPTAAAAQPVTTPAGETKSVCRISDGSDYALVSAAGALLTDASATTQPVSGTVTCNVGTGTQPVSGTLTVTGPLTDAQLRAVAVPVSGTFWQTTQPVSGPVTDAQLRATPVPVSGTVTASGPLTDTQLRATAVPVSGPVTDTQLRAAPVPVSGTVTASGPLTDTQLRATPVPVSGTVTVTDGAGALNVIVDSGSVTVSGTVTANAGSGTQAVSVSSLPLPSGASTAAKQPALGTAGAPSSDVLTVQGATSMTALKVDGSAVTQPVSGPLTDTQIRATALPVSASTLPLPSGAATAAKQPGLGTAGSASTDVITVQGAASMTKLLVTPDSVALPANQSVNVNQVGGSSVSTAATGVQKVGIVGNAGGAFDAANNAAAPANVSVDGFEVATQTVTQPTAATAGNVRRGLARTDGALYVVPGGPVMWSCGLAAVGTTLTQCQAAPGASLRLYITDIVAQSSTATAGLFTLRFGTGSNCATGTGNLLFNSASALVSAPATTTPVTLIHLSTPIPVTANNAICALGVATNTTNIQVNGYSAP